MIKQDYRMNYDDEPEVTRSPKEILKGWMLIWYLIACTIITAVVFALAVNGFFTA